jgi:hypothetical protein
MISNKLKDFAFHSLDLKNHPSKEDYLSLWLSVAFGA